jgi:hypothetical protein
MWDNVVLPDDEREKRTQSQTVLFYKNTFIFEFVNVNVNA